MKKILYSVLATLSGLVLLFSYRTSWGEVIPVDASPATAPSAGAGSAPTGGGTSAAAPHGLTDGTHTGAGARTRYGTVQVQITVSGGVITAVDVPQYPNHSGQDQRINARAIPQLVSETLDAQSASISMVSGATYTSHGYEQSLQSALDQARS